MCCGACMFVLVLCSVYCVLSIKLSVLVLCVVVHCGWVWVSDVCVVFCVMWRVCRLFFFIMP